MSRKKLYIAETKDFDQEVVKVLRRHFEVTFQEMPAGALTSVFRTYDIFWFRLGHRIGADILEQEGRRVRTIVCPATGLDHIDTACCRKLGIPIISLKGESEFLKEVRATAELTLALSLAIIRKLSLADQHVKAGNWQRDLFKGSELYKKKVSIIGYGRLGKITADLFAAFGAQPVVFDESPISESPYPVAQSIEEALRDTSLCSLHITYRTDNQGFFRKEYFQLMPKGSYFVNTSRGSLVDEQALVEALESGHLGGAALDVLNGEPQIKASPLWAYAQEHDNIILTPHIGGNTWESFAKTEGFVAEKLIQHEA